MNSVKLDKASEKSEGQVPENLKVEFSTRLNLLLSEKGWSQSRLADETRLNTSKISEYVRARVMPNAESAILISEALSVRPNWLILGRGERNELRPPASVEKESYAIPLLDTRLAAGAGVLAAENQIGAIDLSPEIMQQLRRTDTKGLYFMRSWGDSMLPTISDDALVLIDTLQTNLREGIIAFRYGEDLRVKRLRPVGLGDIEVISDNPIYAPERIVGTEKEHFDIIGRAIWAGSIL